MIDPDIIRKKYSSMTDEHLVDFAKKEKADLTEVAIKILEAEIQKRGLDNSILKYPESKEIIDPFRILAAAWEQALNERRSGKSDEEIVGELSKAGLSAEQVYVILKRLPGKDYSNEAFENLIRKNCDSATLVSVFVLLFLFGVGVYFFHFGITKHFFLANVIGFVFTAAGIFVIQKYKGEFKGGTFWIDLIKKYPENVVWIKPITEKHTIGFVLTLYKLRHFQFLTKDGLSIKMTCDSDQEQKVFFEGVRHHLPHAQLGYTPEVAAIYGQGPEDFIIKLQRKNIYTPIDKINLE